MSAPEIVRADLQTLPVGLYRLPDRKRLKNGYDLQQDAYFHDVDYTLMARVRCAVSLADAPSRVNVLGVEAVYRRATDHNQIVLAWVMTDCFEWQQERDEKPRTFYRRCAQCGATESRAVFKAQYSRPFGDEPCSHCGARA